MNTKSKWASTIISVSALGATILLSAPVKANCYPNGPGGGIDEVTAFTYNTWAQTTDYCPADTGSAVVQYEVAYADNSSYGNTGFAVTWTYYYANLGGDHSYRDLTCVWCANFGEVCSNFTPWQTVSGGAGEFPPSSYQYCDYGDGAYKAQGIVELQ